MALALRRVWATDQPALTSDGNWAPARASNREAADRRRARWVEYSRRSRLRRRRRASPRSAPATQASSNQTPPRRLQYTLAGMHEERAFGPGFPVFSGISTVEGCNHRGTVRFY